MLHRLLVLWCLFQGIAHATLPTIQSVNPGYAFFNGTANTMMFDVAVILGGASAAGDDTDHDTKVGYLTTASYNGQGANCSTATGWAYAPVQRYSTTGVRTFRLWNFIPSAAYTYRVDVGSGGVVSCGSLGTPSLPVTLNAVHLQYDTNGTPSSPYIISETSDCYTGSALNRKTFLYAINPTLSPPRIVWYLDENAISGGKGAGSSMRYQAGTGSDTGRIMLQYNSRYFYEFGFDGEAVSPSPVDLTTVGVSASACTGKLNSKGPCPHHDTFKSDTTGTYYAPMTRLSNLDAIGTDWEQSCGTSAVFFNDGFIRSDGVNRSLMINYGFNPKIDPGPNPSLDCGATLFHGIFNPSIGYIDWTHVNAATTDNFTGTEYLELSFKDLNRVMRVLATSPYTKQWELANDAASSDFGTVLSTGITGTAGFGDQHDVHFVSADELMMFDNTGDPRGSRVLRMTVDTVAPYSVTINKAWMAMDAAGAFQSCDVEGSAEEVPGTSGARVVALCKDTPSYMELSQSTGLLGTPPPLVVSIAAGATACTNASTVTSNTILGWHRAFPAANLGDF